MRDINPGLALTMMEKAGLRRVSRNEDAYRFLALSPPSIDYSHIATTRAAYIETAAGPGEDVTRHQVSYSIAAMPIFNNRVCRPCPPCFSLPVAIRLKQKAPQEPEAYSREFKMIRYGCRVGLLACVLLSIFGCERTEPMLPKIEGGQQQSPTSDAQKAKDEFLRKSRQEIDQVRSRIDALEAKAQSSSAELKTRLEKQVRDLRDDLKIVEAQWQGVKDASASAWRDMKNTLSMSMEKLKQAIHQASG